MDEWNAMVIHVDPEKMDMERMMKMRIELVERTLRCSGRRGANLIGFNDNDCDRRQGYQRLNLIRIVGRVEGRRYEMRRKAGRR